MLILTDVFKHDTFFIFLAYFHKEGGFGFRNKEDLGYLFSILEKRDVK